MLRGVSKVFWLEVTAMRTARAWACVLALSACAGQSTPSLSSRLSPRRIAAARAASATSGGPLRSGPAKLTAVANGKGFAKELGPGPGPGSSPPPPELSSRFESHLAAHRELGFSELQRELSLDLPPDRPLSFNPERARYAGRVLEKLALSPEERATFRREGAVNVDHDQRYSMAASYYAIFTRDLPVLVTTDSILHAWHRSFDAVLEQLETSQFTNTLAATLQKSHEALLQMGQKLATPKLKESAGDVDVYLTVARNLLANSAELSNGLRVRSEFGNDARVSSLLRKVRGLTLEMPPAFSEFNGGKRPIDYSQFKPRGHYTKSPELTRYFQAMMWLGRADTGFVIAPPDDKSGIIADAERELRSAALLAVTLERSAERAHFLAMSETIDFLVGGADNLGVEQLLKALHDVGAAEPSALEASSTILNLQKVVALPSAQQIRAQVLVPPTGSEQEVQPPALFQLFGQRFLLDSFVLSRLVYDSIWFEGKRVERMMPSGLDVMAALGNDEATRLLRPELERFNYSANLLAARRTVDELPAASFEQSVASAWLGALRRLDDVPARGNFPEAMRRTPFRRKQLQTQLASWAELRHDTVLYGKQSYTAGILCEYPGGYVEPYPEFFAQLAQLSETIERRLGPEAVSNTAYADFFHNFTETLRYLERLARKELDGKPFTAEESGFLKKTIDADGAGCGPPTYDGWYVRLFFGGNAEDWKPTVSDVHTDPSDARVLHEGVGDANFFVLAIDNQHDRATYVGPVYSYYEFTRPASERMTDEQWRTLIENGSLPARPGWWSDAFPAKALKRTLGDEEARSRDPDPRQVAAEKLRMQALRASVPAERQRLLDAAAELERATRTPPPARAK